MENVGRVFAAVPLSPDARLALAEQLSDVEIPARLAPPENWHVTLRFLGTVDQVTYERFLAAVSESELPSSFTVALDSVGAFPNPRRAAVVWAGLARGEAELGTLNGVCEAAAQAAGLPAEERPFHPHVTLARVRPPRSVTHLTDATLDVSYRADRLVVYRSHMGGGPVRYEPLEEYALAR